MKRTRTWNVSNIFTQFSPKEKNHVYSFYKLHNFIFLFQGNRIHQLNHGIHPTVVWIIILSALHGWKHFSSAIQHGFNIRLIVIYVYML